MHPRRPRAAALFFLLSAAAAVGGRTASAQTGFFTLTPCRLLDTRGPAGPYGGPALAPGEKRVFVIAGRCGVPTNSVAIAVDVAVVAPPASGFAQVFPGNGAPPVTSVLNFRAGKTRANNAIVGMATDGAGTMALLNNSTGAADYAVDVSGYFAATSCPTITVTNPAVTTGSEGTPFSQAFGQSGGAGTPTFSLASGALPPGWTLSQGGVLSSANPVFGQFTITVAVHDANLCAGTGSSYTVTIGPGARDDVYGPTIVGNMSIDTSTGTVFSVLANDTAGSTATLVGGGTTAQGGQVALSATGTFTYNPPRGFLGTDTFQYTITKGAQTAGPATVTLHVGAMSWFVDGNPGACSSSCDGRRTNPYTSLAAFQAVNGAGGTNPAAGDVVFLFEAPASYTGPVTLLASQRLVGQDATTSFAAATGLAPPDTTVGVPVMNAGNAVTTTVVSQTVPGANAVNLAQDNTLAGLTVSAVGNAAVFRNGSVGTATLSNVKVVTSGGSDGIFLQNATGSFEYASGSVTAGGSGAALRLAGGNVSVDVAVPLVVTSGAVASITGRTGGSVTVSGSVAAQGGASGVGISAPAGVHSVTFSGPVQLGTGGQALTGGPAVSIDQAGTASTTTFSSLAIVTNGQTAIDAQNGGTLVVSSGSVSATNGRALNLSGIAVDVTLSSIAASTGPAQGIRMASVSGSFTCSGSTNLSSQSLQGILVTSSTVNASFGNTTINGGSDGVSFQGNTGGTRTFGTLAIANNPAGTGFLHTGAGGNVTVTGAATIANTSGPSVQIQGAAAGNAVTFLTGLTVTKSVGTAVSLGGAGASANSATSTISFGSLNVTASNGRAIQAVSTPLGATGGTISANAAPAIDATSVTFAAAFSTVSSTNSSNQGIRLATSAGSLTIGGGSISGAGSNGFDVSGGTVDVTYGGSVSQSSSAFAVSVAGATGGTKTLSGPVSSTGNGRGVSLTSNTGAAVVFTGGLNLSTGANTAFTATGGGTLTVTQNNTSIFNVLTTTIGTALSLSNVTIGNLGVTFRSISSTGATSGIVLASTGLGPFTISGNGGSCSSAGTCTGGAIVSSTGPGISLTSTGAVSLTRVAVESGFDDGIRGTTVGGFTLTSSRIVNNGNGPGENGIDLTDLSGSGGIASSTLTGNAEEHVKISNSSGVLSSFNVTGSTFSNNAVASGGDAFWIGLSGTSSATVSVTGSTFSHNNGSHFRASTAAGSANVTLNVTFSGNALTGDRGSGYGGTDIRGNVIISAQDNAQVQFDVSNNGTAAAPFTGAVDSAIRIDLGPSSNAVSLLHGTIHNNFIGSAAVVDSGSSKGDGIEILSEGQGTTRVAVTNNTIRQYGFFSGVSLENGRGFASLQATVTGNTVANPGTNAFNGVFVVAGELSGDAGLLCLDFGGAGALANTIGGSGPGNAADIGVTQSALTTVRLPGYAGGSTDLAAVVTYLQGRNNAPMDASAGNHQPGGGFVGGAACAAP
jgi:hypothetical protein